MAGAIRQPIDIPALERFIVANVPDISVPIEVKQFGYGQSNPTYQLTDRTGMRFVMRKKPPGKLLSQTAHKVEREYRIIKALEKTDVPVPKAYCLCEDASVIGTPFYIMEFLDGRVIEDPALPDVSPEHRREMWRDAVRTLAKFHRVEPASVGLEKFGKHSGFYNRQLATFNTLESAQAKAVDKETGVPVGHIPHFEEMVRFFSDPSQQPKDRATLVHGDYKIDNMVFHKTEPRVIGILDWEMATIGHPLSDLANLMSPFVTAGSEDIKRARKSHTDFDAGTCPGLPTENDCICWYAEGAGWDPQPELLWAEAFGIYRGTIITQGIAARHAMRVASSEHALEYASIVGPYAELAWHLIQECKASSSKPKL